MSKKTISLVLMVGGALLALVSLLAVTWSASVLTPGFMAHRSVDWLRGGLACGWLLAGAQEVEDNQDFGAMVLPPVRLVCFTGFSCSWHNTRSLDAEEGRMRDKVKQCWDRNMRCGRNSRARGMTPTAII